jgi:hypothetical protein
MKYFAAKVLSVVLHPVIFGVLLPFLVIYHSTTDVMYGIKWTAFTSIFLFASVFVFFIIHPKDFLRDFDVSKREKRPLFYAIFLFFALMYFVIALTIKGLFFPMSIVALGAILAIVVFEFANFYLKISIHAAIATAYVITVGLLYGFVPFLAVCWMPFAVSWSRVVLKKHTRREVVLGAFLGMLLTLITFALGRLLL